MQKKNAASAANRSIPLTVKARIVIRTRVVWLMVMFCKYTSVYLFTALLH